MAGGGGGVFCNVGIVLTGVQCSRRCLFSLQLSYAGFQLIVYPSSMSTVDENFRRLTVCCYSKT